MDETAKPTTETGLSQEEKLKEITDKLEQGIRDLFSSGRFKDYLKVMSKFHNYSVNNMILISLQRPEATLVAGYDAWERKFDRHVQKGEKGIKIIAPSPYKINKEVDKLDPQTKQPIIGSDGRPIKEHIEKTIPAYRVTTVFDVSQTVGKDLPEIITDLKHEVDGYDRLYDALKSISPVPIEERSIEGHTHGYYHLEDKSIVIRDGMSQQQTLKTLIHELAHAILHDRDVGLDHLQDRNTKEIEAESVAYTVCQHFGIDTSEYSFGYVAGWSQDKELEELKSCMTIIRNTASNIINSVEKELYRSEENEKHKTIEESRGAVQTTLETPVIDKEIEKNRSHGRHH